MKKRLKALEAKSAQEGLIMLNWLRWRRPRPRRRRMASSRASIRAIAAPPGYPERGRSGLSADLHRHLHQSGLRQAVRSQDANHAADLLNDRVIPLFESHDVKLMRMLTDHSRTKTKRPQTNGICERFHKIEGVLPFRASRRGTFPTTRGRVLMPVADRDQDRRRGWIRPRAVLARVPPPRLAVPPPI
jgi:hypothetical protein